MQPHSLDVRAMGPGARAIGDEWEVCVCVVCVCASRGEHPRRVKTETQIGGGEGGKDVT